MKYIDAHCHILSEAQMKTAMACGVGRFIINATRTIDWETIVELAQYDNVYGAIGVHPWFVSGLPDDWDVELVNALVANPNLMVGEIGLDKNRPDFEVQESVFCRQLQIAHDLERVIHIHCVGAWGKMMDILRSVDLPPAMVFHAFSGAPELMHELMGLGAYFSFGTGIMDVRHSKIRASVAVAPVSRILAESDAPDVAMPDTIPNTVAEIARVRNQDAEQLAKTIYNNTKGLINDGQV